jgi:hypothetical protein
MLPHVDRLVSAHNLVSFGDLRRLLAGTRSLPGAHDMRKAA